MATTSRTIPKPNQGALVAFENHEIVVYTDATWHPQPGRETGWVLLPGAQLYASGTGNAKIMTTYGHYKLTLIQGPSGTRYDTVAIINGARP